MSAVQELLSDGFGRVHDVVTAAVRGLDEDQLAARIDPDANSIAWLVWHLTRIQDDHVAGVAGSEQVWSSGGWAPRFGFAAGDEPIGYGDSSADVAALRAPTDLLLDYLDAVHARTLEFVAGLADEDLARVVDENWDPPVTLSVRLVSVLSDDLQHAGQAAFVRGVLSRR